jgi:hypothetical protein
MRTVFDKLNDAHVKYYNRTENFAVDVITVLFKGTIIKEILQFGLKSTSYVILSNIHTIQACI